MLAEIMGKASGYCKGRGGSMHISSAALNNLGANGIVGGGIPIATGAAMGIQVKGTDQVVVAFFSDGASNNGVFAESMNMAGIFRLPVIYMLENNHYAVSTPIECATGCCDLAGRGPAYGVPGVCVDGNDAVAVYRETLRAVERARRGEGPTLIEARTYRHGGHHVNDPGLYMDPAALAEWKERDPLITMRRSIGTRRPDRRHRGRGGCRTGGGGRICAPTAPSRLWRNSLVRHQRIKEQLAMAEMKYREALRRALDEEMQRDPLVFLMGETIAERGGSYKVTEGLFKKYGPRRVIDTPIAEASFTGMAIGAASIGCRPVVEILFIDFAMLAMDQIVNQAAKMEFISGGQRCVPMVVRTQGGAGNGLAAQHSQSLEAFFYHVPGLKVVMPSTAHDAYGLLKSAIRDDGPVIFIEHKLLYMTKG